MPRLLILFLAAAVFSPLVLPSIAQSSQPVVAGDLTLNQAITRALQSSPSLAAGGSAVSAAEARITQAGLFPNPEIEFEAENFGGDGDLNGYNAAESTVVISQPFLLGGKRGRRRAVAESDHLLAGRDLEAVRLDVISDTTSAFFRVVAAQEREALAEELLGLAERFANTVQARADAGKVSPVEATRAKIEVAQAQIRLVLSVRELAGARALLAATWGSSSVDFGRAIGELTEPETPPPLPQLQSLLIKTPEVMRLENQIERQQRILEFENSFRIPDLVASLGPRRFEETGQSAWVAGLSMEIPIFDRNQGSRKAAEFALERTRRDTEAIRVAVEAKLTVAFERLHAAALAAMTMSREVVPAAETAFKATEIGYNEGKFGFLDVLDAQRTLFEVRSLSLDSHEEYAITRTFLERLIGRPLDKQTPATAGADNSSQGVSP